MNRCWCEQEDKGFNERDFVKKIAFGFMKKNFKKENTKW